MIRSLTLGLLALAFAVGCSNKEKDSDGGGGTPTEQGGDPTASYTIKLRKSQTGDKFRATQSERGKANFTANIQGKSMSKAQDGGQEFAYTETILEKPDPDKKPTKLVRDYSKAERVKSGAKTVLPYAGKTVEITKGPAGYTFKIKGGTTLVGDAADELRKEFAKDDEKQDKLLPNKPVKLNETWTVDPKSLGGEIEDNPFFDLPKTTLTGKLTKVYQKDGKQFGVIEYTINLALKPTAQGKVTGTVTMDVCIDGTSDEGSMTMKMAGNLKVSDKGVDIDIILDMTKTATQTPIK